MGTHDDHIEGQFNYFNPANHPELTRLNESLRYAFEDNNEEYFYSIVSEIETRINRMREVCKASDNDYLLKQLNTIYQKL